MSESDDRVEDALAAYLGYLEVGGQRPNVDHLNPSEKEKLEELIAVLELTEGVAFGLGRRDETEAGKPTSLRDVSEPVAKLAPSGPGERLLSTLRESLPFDVRIVPDTNPFVSRIGEVEIVAGWIVGTFGGRIRVWLLDSEETKDLEKNSDSLFDLNRVFGIFPDTMAVALVGQDLSCLLVRPEDCAPHIEVPGGSVGSRSYLRPIQPVYEAVSAFLRELIPHWDPIPWFGVDPAVSIDVSAIGGDAAIAAIEVQRGIGERAHKGPKKNALVDLGKRESAALSKIAIEVYEGSLSPDNVGPQIKKLAKIR